MQPKHIALYVVVGLALVCGVSHADGPSLTLLPGARVQYRLDYQGTGSQIVVALDVSDSTGVSMWIYTPEQLDAMRRGEQPAPVGRGTPNKGHSLFWAGGFKISGVFRVVVENAGSAPVLYHLDITGDGVNGVSQIMPAAPPPTAAVSVEKGQKYLAVSLPPGAMAVPGDAAFTLRLAMPPEPKTCTHSNQLPAQVGQSIKLCPNEIYSPFRVSGNNIGVYSDDAHSAVVSSQGRQFAITMEGSNNWIEGVTIQARADPADLGAWLCLYDECIFPTRPVTTTLRGGTLYGGGILLKGANSTVHRVTVRGGTIGIATVLGRSNNIIENQLSDLNGWGSFNIGSVGSYFVGNTLNRDNHGCTTPDGRKFLHGCETAGWVCLGCTSNVIARNRCELSANCYYMSGERGLASNNNRLVGNYCAGATDNCFEITFAKGNVLRDNVATVETKTDATCKYPFWVGGSIVYFHNNTWECDIAEDDALAQARNSTPVQTGVLPLGALSANPGVPKATAMPTKGAVVQPTARPLGRGTVSVGDLIGGKP